MVTSMNPFVSLEDILSPHGEPKAPVIGLMVEDWDVNLKQDVEHLVNLGHSVMILPINTSVEGFIGDGNPMGYDKVVGEHEPQVLFYYKGRPEDASESIPVLMVEEGRVKVDMEGRMKELAEVLGLLEDSDHVDAYRP